MKPRDRMELRGDVWRYYLDNAEVSEAAYRAVYPPVVDDGEFVAPKSCSAWPLQSDALAVHPSQIAEAEERNRRHGISVTYEPEFGLAIIPDRDQRRKLMRLERCHDKDGGYGDG